MSPDPVTTTVAILSDRLPNTSVSTVIPADLAAAVPLVHVASPGSRITAPLWRAGPVREAATVALSCWAGPDHHAARTLARDVLAELLPLRSLSVPGGVLVGIAHLAGPAHVSDTFAPDGVYRYVSTVTVTTH